MVTLQQMVDIISAYLKIHGNKAVAGISTYNGSSDVQYTLNLYDTYNGPVGSNPLTGEDHLDLLKDDVVQYVDNSKDNILEPVEEPKNNMTAYFAMEQELLSDKNKDMSTKMKMIYGALTILQHMGEIDNDTMGKLWKDFTFRGLGLK